METAELLGQAVDVLIEVPRGGRVKHRSDGSVDFVTPVGAPFNYGCIPGSLAGDGDPLDVVLVGPRLPRGTETRATVWGVVRFVDGGLRDDKLICGHAGVTAVDRWRVGAMFRAYPLFKRLLYAWRGVSGTTRVEGVIWWSGAA
jgi:inorganic pyrophosphatase